MFRPRAADASAAAVDRGEEGLARSGEGVLLLLPAVPGVESCSMRRTCLHVCVRVCECVCKFVCVRAA
jgi:hypothetical protein